MMASQPGAALLVLDMQQTIVDSYGGSTEQLEKVATALAWARGAGMLTIFVELSFRPGYPDVSPRNRTFQAITESGRFSAEPGGPRFPPAIAPLEADLIVTKKRVSAFVGSDLDLILRSRNVGTLAMCGIATSGVVLSTLRQASDLDYDLVVLSDGCADTDSEVHELLLRRIFPRQAAVVTVKEWCSARP
jgi:nicotinamidase-related amidase